MIRILWLGLGGLLVLTGMVIGPLPGPLGTPLVLAGLLIVLRNSLWARRRYIRLSRRWPVSFRVVDKVLRRRRRARRAGAATEDAAAA